MIPNNINHHPNQADTDLIQQNLNLKHNIYHVPSFLVKLYDIVDNLKNY